MDACNRFETPATFRLYRLEYAVALAVCVTLFVVHLDQVRWVPALILFAYIDVVGYLPGMIAQRRTAAVPKICYLLYNAMHSFVTQAVVTGLWIAVFGFEWALLAIPIHLCGDRCLFGNAMKPFAVPFDATGPIPAFAEFESRLTPSSHRDSVRTMSPSRP
ncbi:hypothetical protein NDR87_20840 [Nocardia sp. CDC159]|uniref:Integral membrane protein n=1 Tax=Nocardia pulmonis TaxID=2951408 RepID=A0A9X2IZ55_9NOCA|nr:MULTISPECIES: hypothetical protein [Nocardia]MCM6776394.1 hypothetical protein [Nocardia pulmonis]MCM6788818.1 hypothetical protein [Nocardia sp. CDC159]